MRRLIIIIIIIIIRRLIRRRNMSKGADFLNPLCNTSICISRSFAVAERPRDALCLSVVSLNKRITRADSVIIVT